MTAVPASSSSIKTLADGTLRLALDFEPRHAQDAFRLFGSPGTAVAVAALKPTPAPVEKVQPEPSRRAVGTICQWLVMRAKEPEFQTWVAKKAGLPTPASENAAAEFCRLVCGVESRKDVDGNDEAERRYHEGIRGPYSKWRLARGKQSDAA